jgi:hypothetical protein
MKTNETIPVPSTAERTPEELKKYVDENIEDHKELFDLIGHLNIRINSLSYSDPVRREFVSLLNYIYKENYPY